MARKNFPITSVVTAPSPVLTGTTIKVASGTAALLHDVPFKATAHPSGQAPTMFNAEIVNVTAKDTATDILTIQRAQGGTTAKSIATGWVFFASRYAEDDAALDASIHTHSNKTTLDAITSPFTTEKDTRLNNTETTANAALSRAGGTITGTATFNNNIIAPGLASNISSSLLRLSGGASDTGAVIVLGGPTHSSIPNIGNARIGATTIIAWSSTGVAVTGTFSSTGAMTSNGADVVTTSGTQTMTNKTLTSPTLTTPALGAATATSVNKVVLTSPATAATLTLADGSTLATSGAFSTTLTATAATNVTLPTSGTLVNRTGAERLSNKRIDPRVLSIPGSVTPFSADITAYDQVNMNAVGAAVSFSAPTGTPADGQKFIFKLKATGSIYALTWDAIFRPFGVALPTQTTANKTLYVGMIYNSSDTKWDVVSVVQEL